MSQYAAMTQREADSIAWLRRIWKLEDALRAVLSARTVEEAQAVAEEAIEQ